MKERTISQDQKATNQRANAMPTDGYVLTIDGKLKTRYETESEAQCRRLEVETTFPGYSGCGV